MTPAERARVDLVRVSYQRNVCILESVGTTEALGSMTLGALKELGGNLLARLENLGEKYPSSNHPYPQLVHDIGVVSAEMARRQPGTNAA